MDAARRENLALIAAGPLGMLALTPLMGPWQKLAVATLGLLYFLKVCLLLQGRVQLSPGALTLYMTVWPGMDPAPLARRKDSLDASAPRFAGGLAYFIGGSAGLLALVLFSPWISESWTGWLGIATLLLIIHFGLSGILTASMWLAGYRVRPLFESPFAANSLRDFWTRRWNLPFVEMNRLLFIGPLTSWLGLRWAVFGVFVISGILHELAISYPAGAGWGGPFLYFVIQGGLVLLESRFGLRSRVLAWLGILLPMPLLFHEAFQSAFITPLIRDLHQLAASRPAEWYVGSGLWLLGALQLCVLIASFQVPGRLKWPEELPRLSSFNRKLMWTQGLFIVTTIVAFAVLTLVLHDEMLRGDRAALAIAGFAGVFWTMRLLVDANYYKHEDWPEGPQFIIGHTLLNCLFVLLASGYWGIILWHRIT